jgi:hypothetical protein
MSGPESRPIYIDVCHAMYVRNKKTDEPIVVLNVVIVIVDVQYTSKGHICYTKCDVS